MRKYCLPPLFWISLLFVGGLLYWCAAFRCLVQPCAALCNSSRSVLCVQQTIDFFLGKNCHGNCSSISLWKVWIARGILLSLEWVICKLVLCIFVAIHCLIQKRPWWASPVAMVVMHMLQKATTFLFLLQISKTSLSDARESTRFCKLLTSLSVLSGSVCKIPISAAF